MKSPFLFDRLYIKLGRPAWFWPSVMACVFFLYIVGSSVATDAVLS